LKKISGDVRALYALGRRAVGGEVKVAVVKAGQTVEDLILIAPTKIVGQGAA